MKNDLFGANKNFLIIISVMQERSSFMGLYLSYIILCFQLWYLHVFHIYTNCMHTLFTTTLKQIKILLMEIMSNEAVINVMT